MEGVDELVGPDLARRVGRLRLDRVVLGDRDGAGRAVDLAGRDVDEAPGAGVERGAGRVERAEHVGLEEVPRVDERVRDRDLGAEVEDDLGPGDGGGDGLDVAEVAEDDVDLRRLLRVEPVERAPLVSAVVADERPDGGALTDQPGREMPADEPAGAGDEDRAAVQFTDHVA